MCALACAHARKPSHGAIRSLSVLRHYKIVARQGQFRPTPSVELAHLFHVGPVLYYPVFHRMRQTKHPPVLLHLRQGSGAGGRAGGWTDRQLGGCGMSAAVSFFVGWKQESKRESKQPTCRFIKQCLSARGSNVGRTRHLVSCLPNPFHDHPSARPGTAD